MLQLTDLEKYDTQGMFRIYDKWADIAKESYESDLEPIDLENIDHIVFAGMGGSGALGNIFNALLSKTNIHVSTVKGYLLPKTVDSKTLVIATSISGNTIETLTALDSAFKLPCKIIGFSSGGKLEKFCTNNKIDHRKIPLYSNPRTSFPAYLYSILKVMNSIIPINKDSVIDSIKNLENLSKKISSDNLTDTNPSIKLAQWISGIPIIYYPHGLQAAAIRFKNSIQENMKTHAISEDVIEACHNGIVAWETISNVKPILIQGADDYIKTKERWSILKDYFHENQIEFRTVSSIQGDILSKLITLIYELDYTTIYRAVLSGTDPSPVKPIDFVKSRL